MPKNIIGSTLATVYDIMVHYDRNLTPAGTLPPPCPKCGSHRTQVVGSSDSPRTIVVRCNGCGERSPIVVCGDSKDTGRTAVAEPLNDNAAPESLIR